MHFCSRCINHWGGQVRRHNCGAGEDCRVAAMTKQCNHRRDTTWLPSADTADTDVPLRAYKVFECGRKLYAVNYSTLRLSPRIEDGCTFFNEDRWHFESLGFTIIPRDSGEEC